MLKIPSEKTRILSAICVVAVCIPLRRAQAGPHGAEEIAAALQRAAEDQQTTLCSYFVHRTYRLKNKHIHPDAVMEVDVRYARGKAKEFHISSMQASGIARRSFEDLLKAEAESRGLDNPKASTAPANYDFTLIGHEEVDAVECYKVAMTPKRTSKYLIYGTAWVSEQDSMFVQIDGVMSRSPSFWLSKPRIEQRFSNVDGFWLPTFNRSTAKVLFLGDVELTIQYSRYSAQKCQSGT